MLQMTRSEARRLRLLAQGVSGASRAGGPASGTAARRTPADVVHRMVAMQGQDLAQVLRAIAVRSAPGTTLAEVRAAFDRGELVRSWAMRGTLFVATPPDLAALHAAVAPRMRRQEWRMCTDGGIDERTARRSAEALTDHLAGGPRSRRSLLAAWDAASIETAAGRGYHLLALHALDGLVRFGPFDGEEQLLLGGGAPPVADPDAALTDALRRCVAARGPTAVEDVAWWSGLPKLLVRASLASAPGLEPVLVDGAPMLRASDAAAGARSGVRLIPGFDEWVLGYRDRSHTASARMLQAMVPGGNGVFKPVVLVDGRAVGTWRWPTGGRQAREPQLQLVEPVTASTRASIHRAVEAWPHR
ncbi:winged helix DNA-binding domain-containing protein [Agrococcus sp. Ld7]|uniref:winged helix DNA-binding domain-containing protein n=1 Tax=Agrococcus sp. Ld7 TaxID=649148 RepID=UPI00386C1FC3